MAPSRRMGRAGRRGGTLALVMGTEGREDGRVTDAGIEISSRYGPESLGSFDPDRDLGAPGEAPFTRGVYPSMYRGRVWTMRQYAGMGTARDTNERFRYLLKQGQTGLSVA